GRRGAAARLRMHRTTLQSMMKRLGLARPSDDAFRAPPGCVPRTGSRVAARSCSTHGANASRPSRRRCSSRLHLRLVRPRGSEQQPEGTPRSRVSGKLADDTAEEACETTAKMAFTTKTRTTGCDPTHPNAEDAGRGTLSIPRPM